VQFGGNNGKIQIIMALPYAWPECLAKLDLCNEYTPKKASLDLEAFKYIFNGIK
jgi:hypothetical protein